MKSFVFATLFSEVYAATNAKCQAEARPYHYKETTPYDTTVVEDTYTSCPSDKPALFTSANTGTEADSGSSANTRTQCCQTEVACSTTYGPGKTVCPTDTVLQGSRKCFTVNSMTSPTACGSQSATAGDDVTIDKKYCCPRKCDVGMALSTGKIAGKVETLCTNKDASRINPDGYCRFSTCTDPTDLDTCCQSVCETRYQAKGGTDKMSDTTTKKTECAEGETVATGVFCSQPDCLGATDADTCCLTKCDAEKGWEPVSGDPAKGSDDKKSDCAKDLRVHKTANCKGRDCTGSSSVCCQQKCTAGFKLKDATTDEANECGDGLSVHETEWCEGSKCGASDAKTCCQQKCAKGFKLKDAKDEDISLECPKDTTVSDVKCTGSPCNEKDDEKLCCSVKCTDKTTGFQLAEGTGDSELFCKKGETVADSKSCDGDCSDDDASTCCLAKNNTTGSTTDANGAGLAAAVGMLIVLSVAS